MSIFNFVAGDKPFEDFSRGVEPLNKNTIIIDEKRYVNVYAEDDSYSAAYTAKPYIMGIEFEFFGCISGELLGYIKKQMESHKEIELWTMWMDEKEDPERRACNANDLSLGDLEWIYGTKEYVCPKCLKIYRWSK